MRILKIMSLAILLSTVQMGLCFAGGVGGIPAVANLSLDQVQLKSFPALDLSELVEEDSWRRDEGLPERFAIPQDVSFHPENSGTWEILSDGHLLWRLRLACPSALSLNLGFTEYHLPVGAELRIYSADGRGNVLQFNSDDNRSSSQLWTPVLLTEELVVELEVSSTEKDLVSLELGRIGCGYRYFGEDRQGKSGSCNIDVICPEGDDWRDDISSVGMYSINGTQLCSGVMVNNTSEDKRPLFLTANHCPISDTNVSTVVVYWNYESQVCGEYGGGSLLQFSHGDTILAAHSASDFKLLELDESPDPVFGVAYAGWDRSGDVPGSAVCIHHPSTDEKSISFENDPLTVTTYLETEVPGNGSHLRVEDWDLGTTEGGSSGSPLFDEDHRIIGQLHGGYAGCGNNLSDWYGRIFVSWEGGGTASTRLRDFLDPAGTGVMVLNRYGYTDPGPEPSPPGDMDLYFASISPNPFLIEAEVKFHMNQAGVVHARVLNILGQLVLDLGNISGVDGDNTLTWDGRNQYGRPAPSGLYIIYLESAGQTARGQVVRLK